MASFVAKEWQPLSVLKMFTMDWSDQLLVVLVSCSSQEVLPLQCCDAD
jgi:hypothetical protein